MKILIAEDDPVSQIVASKAVEALDHEVAIVEDGISAWNEVLRLSPDVLITDWMMPGLDGLELCRRIRHEPNIPYTYVIMLTARDERQHVFAGMAAGADDYLAKPLDREELELRLMAAARITALHRRIHQQQTELERANAELAGTARTDALTGLGNRRRLDEDLGVLMARAQRHGETFAVALCDIDLFKLYNDTYGHLAGDEVLGAVAGAILSEKRASDMAHRYGGEEFTVLLSGEQTKFACVFAERLRSSVAARSIPLPGSPYGIVTVSIGIAGWVDGFTDDAVLQAADQALYRAKAAGRNAVIAAVPG